MGKPSETSPRIELENIPADVKSFIHQTLQELEEFTTDKTTIVVIARDPSGLLTADLPLPEGVSSARELKKMYRIAIAISQEGVTVEGEGLNKNIFEAIRLAKDNVFKQMVQIQDEMMSQQERIAQIEEAISGQQIH
jgi:hypothetical protein